MGWEQLPGWIFLVPLATLIFVTFVWWDHRNLPKG